MTSTLNNILSDTVLSFVYTSIEAFALEQAKNVLSQKIAYYQSRIDSYEKKYGSNYDTFCQNFDQLTNYSIIDKENDSIQWEVALDMKGIISDELNKLLV